MGNVPIPPDRFSRQAAVAFLREGYRLADGAHIELPDGSTLWTAEWLVLADLIEAFDAPDDTWEPEA